MPEAGSKEEATNNVELELFPKEESEEYKQVEVLIEKYRKGEDIPEEAVEYIKILEGMDFDKLLKEVPDKPVVSYLNAVLPSVTEIHIVCGSPEKSVVVKIDTRTNSCYGYTISQGKRIWANDIITKGKSKVRVNDALIS